MQTSSIFVYAIGFLAQAFFSARTLVQWILSERAHRVLSPSIYWIFSLAGSILLFSYGWMRGDFSIILGQLISYYIYIWNLNIKQIWRQLPLIVRGIILVLPVVAIVEMWGDGGTSFREIFFRNQYVPLWMLIYGSLGQIIFTVRFVYQWYYSHKLQQSVLPVGFWVISLVGSGIIISYGIMRLDPVLILGQSVGFVAYLRNIMIYRRK